MSRIVIIVGRRNSRRYDRIEITTAVAGDISEQLDRWGSEYSLKARMAIAALLRRQAAFVAGGVTETTTLSDPPEPTPTPDPQRDRQ